MILPCLTFSIIRYISRVQWRNPRRGFAPSPTPCCSSYWKGSFRVALEYGRQLYIYGSLETRSLHPYSSPKLDHMFFYEGDHVSIWLTTSPELSSERKSWWEFHKNATYGSEKNPGRSTVQHNSYTVTRLSLQ